MTSTPVLIAVPAAVALAALGIVGWWVRNRKRP